MSAPPAAARRHGRLVCWTVTLQLAARLRERREARLLAASGLFDEDFYRMRHPGVGASGLGPVTHSVRSGAHDLATNPFVQRTGMNPLLHDLRVGARLRRAPSRRFDPAWYCARHPEAGATHRTPLEHSLDVGRAAGLAPVRFAAPAEVVGRPLSPAIRIPS